MKQLVRLGILLAVVALGCGSDGPEAGSPGAYGGPCLPDGGCDAGLQCLDHVCQSASN
ncbi:MAG: hypothetical protein VCC02_04750 [Myxococcota bacterium]